MNVWNLTSLLFVLINLVLFCRCCMDQVQSINYKLIRCNPLEKFVYPNYTCFARSFNRSCSTGTARLWLKKPITEFYVSWWSFRVLSWKILLGRRDSLLQIRNHLSWSHPRTKDGILFTLCSQLDQHFVQANFTSGERLYSGCRSRMSLHGKRNPTVELTRCKIFSHSSSLTCKMRLQRQLAWCRSFQGAITRRLRVLTLEKKWNMVETWRWSQV